MIFISHDSHRIREADLFKRLAIKYGICPEVSEIFLSSDANSIPSGELWVNHIFESLRNCQHFVALISDKTDFENKWILFETAFVKGRESKPSLSVFVFGQMRMQDVPWPLGALHLIDTGNTDRVWTALVKMGVREEDASVGEFAHLFRQCGCYRNPKEPCNGVRI